MDNSIQNTTLSPLQEKVLHMLLEGGHNVKSIARACDCTPRWVYEIIRNPLVQAHLQDAQARAIQEMTNDLIDAQKSTIEKLLYLADHAEADSIRLDALAQLNAFFIRWYELNRHSVKLEKIESMMDDLL